MQPASAISAFVAAYPTLALIILFFLPAGTSAVVANPISPHINVSISFNVSAVIAICHASPSVQLVSHHLLQVSSVHSLSAAFLISFSRHRLMLLLLPGPPLLSYMPSTRATQHGFRIRGWALQSSIPPQDHICMQTTLLLLLAVMSPYSLPAAVDLLHGPLAVVAAPSVKLDRCS